MSFFTLSTRPVIDTWHPVRCSRSSVIITMMTINVIATVQLFSSLFVNNKQEEDGIDKYQIILFFYFSLRIRRASCISLGMIVTRLA